MSRLILVMLLLGACGHLGFDHRSVDAPGADVPGTDTPNLVVTRSDDRMAGPPTMSSLAELPAGTVGLSLREALTIANHHAGPDWIGFDDRMLPGGTTITIGDKLVIGDSGTRIDASNVAITIAGATGYTGALLAVTGSDAVVEGLLLQGGGIAVEAASVTGLVLRKLMIRETSSHAIQIEGCARVTVEDSRIERPAGDPLVMRATSDAWVQRNFVVLLTKTGSVHGFALDQVIRSHIIDNIIDPGEAHLIRLTNSSDNELIGNVLDRGESGITIYGSSDRNLVFRNVVIAPRYDAVYLESPAANNKVINNTFYQSGNVSNGGVNTIVANNLVSTNLADFVNPTAYDFHLVAGNTAIDAATDLGLDMLPDKPERYLGSQPDMGAVESY